MIDKLVGALLGFALCKAMGWLQSGQNPLSSLFAASYHPTPSGGHLMTPPPPPGGLQYTSTAAPFPTAAPKGLPPWPTGWKPARLTQDVIQRAQILLGTLKVGQSKLEQSTDGRWIRYVKSKQGTKTLVAAWEPKTQVGPSLQAS